MRALMIGVVLLLGVTLASPARAGGMNNLKAAVNGIATCWLDPFHFVYEPPDDFEELPLHQVTGRILALPAGILNGGFRLVMGVTDVVFFPLWVMPTMSPRPRIELIQDVEYDY